MIWLVLRRQRAALLLAAGLVVVMAVVLIVGRLRFLAAGAELGLLPCISDPDGECAGNAWNKLNSDFASYWGPAHLAVIASPALLGVLAGAGLFGREFDHGTHVLALTQSVSRVRWWLTGLLVAGLPAILGAAAITRVATWGLQPFHQFGNSFHSPRFEVAGILPIAHVLLAFSVAASIGFLLRSTVAAIVITLALQAVLLFVLAVDVRKDYLPPRTVVITLPSTEGASYVNPPDDSWFLGGDQVDAQGNVVPYARFGIGCNATSAEEYQACLTKAGVVANRLLYHPTDRFWPFQLIESGILAVLSAAALAVGYVGLRRKVS